MAYKVSDGAIRFSGRRGRSSAVTTTRIEDDETITMSDGTKSVTLNKTEDPDRVTRGTLTRNEVPPARRGKRKHYRRPWRGEEMTDNRTKAAYAHVDEDGVEREIRVTATKPESWRGTRSPELVAPERAGGRGMGYQGVKRWSNELHSVGYHEGTCEICKEA
jgi:hypothetical protein